MNAVGYDFGLQFIMQKGASGRPRLAMVQPPHAVEQMGDMGDAGLNPVCHFFESGVGVAGGSRDTCFFQKGN